MENIICKEDVSVETFTKKELIRFMMNNLHEAALLCRWGRNGNIKIIDFNPLAGRFLGFNHAELKQMNIYEIFTSESIGSAKKNLNPIPYESDDIWETEILTKKGQKLQVEITNYKFISEGGILILLSLKDISVHKGELLEEKAEAEQKNHLRQALISTISNEIYAPMNRIVGYCQLLNQKDLTQETREDYTESINKSCSLLHKLITDILDISRIEEEKASVQSNKICISELLNETLIEWQPEALRKGIDIRLTLEDIQNDLTVTSDESKLIKVISNLIDNAIRFTLEGYIEIGCLKKESDLLFYIKDTGIGMSSVQYEMISELFCQADTNSSQCYSGKGSGLAISKYYINILGGSIWIDSKLREGSTFYFTIPFSNGTDSIEKIKIPETDNNIPYSRTCLIVDELEVNYYYLKALLTPMGFNVLWAKDGDEAIYMSIIEHVDIVLMDIKMPVTDDGYETTKIIKRKRPDILVFAQSVHAMKIDKGKAILAGFDDIITKPVSRGDFMKKVDSIYEYK